MVLVVMVSCFHQWLSKILCEYIVEGKTSEILESLSLTRFKDKKIEHEMAVVG